MALYDRMRMVWRTKNIALRMVRHSHSLFSQYAEDVIFRQLMHPSNHGTYVDVGAHHPFKGSNTYGLYLRGWRGLTIDPNPRFAPLFKKVRPEDVHLVEGVAREQGDLTYYQFDHDVLNSLSFERAQSLVQAGNRVIAESKIPCRPLGLIVDEYLSDRPIDLLSVDCEGLDLDVLISLDLEKRRPTALIVEDYAIFESFQTNSKPQEFETFLYDSGYRRIAQTAWSTILVAADWRQLIERSTAYRADRFSNGYMPNEAVAAP